MKNLLAPVSGLALLFIFFSNICLASEFADPEKSDEYQSYQPYQEALAEPCQEKRELIFDAIRGPVGERYVWECKSTGATFETKSACTNSCQSRS